jgi:DNA-binding MarR family transcriptional regulator
MEDINEIGFQVKTISNLIKRKIDKSRIKSDVDKLTGMHSWIIKYLYDNQYRDVFQRDLESEFSIRRSTVTGILQLMEKNNLITRESVGCDARLKKIVLTSKAVEFHNMIEADIKEIEAQLAKGLTKEELDQFFRTVAKIKKNLEE